MGIGRYGASVMLTYRVTLQLRFVLDTITAWALVPVCAFVQVTGLIEGSWVRAHTLAVMLVSVWRHV